MKALIKLTSKLSELVYVALVRSCRRRIRCLVTACSLYVLTSGCAFISKQLPENATLVDKGDLSESQTTIGERADAASKALRVSNPRAQQIRFDGRERLLGGGSCQVLPSSELANQLQELIEQKKLRSASTLVQLHRRSACRLLLDQPQQNDRQLTDFITGVLDRGSGRTNWQDLVKQVREKPDQASQWQKARLAIVEGTPVTPDIECEMQTLDQAASDLGSPLFRVEAMRLRGQLQIANGDTSAALESLVSAAELAAEHGLASLTSDLWLMSCEASLRLDLIEQSRQCWNAAVSSGMASIHTRGINQSLPTVDTVYWEQVVRLAHPGDKLPKELTLSLAPWHSRLGIRMDETLTPEIALWCAIAEYQLATGQPHLASLSIKRAETADEIASHARPYLQIALARAMAAQGQQSVATTILGTLTESDDPRVRASSLATLGSIKMHSWAYEQGSRFLGQALAINEAESWPGRLAAEADFANAHLIMGKLDDALPRLHSVQAEMLKQDRWQSLCHSLTNEAALLELDGRTQEAELVRQRIDSIESRLF
ncbi:MAG: hypothetical protein AAF539_11960 [Planctomycetota bacterium]